MRLALKLHPDTPCEVVNEIAVEAVRATATTLSLRYVVSGSIGDLLIPPLTTPTRADELWRHTCFEAFIGPLNGPEYYEFNFAPSKQWAAYSFSGYREDMGATPGISAPDINVQSNNRTVELKATLRLDGWAGQPDDAPWRLGLAAVIEEIRGRKSYWALTHPAGKPDFHNPQGFAAQIAMKTIR